MSGGSMPSRAGDGGMDRTAEEEPIMELSATPGPPAKTRPRFRRGGASATPRAARPAAAQQAGDPRDMPSGVNMGPSWILDYDDANCTIGAAVGIIGEKWTF